MKLNTTGFPEQNLLEPTLSSDHIDRFPQQAHNALDLQRHFNEKPEICNVRASPEAATFTKKSTSQLFTPQMKTLHSSNCVTTPGPRRAPLFKNSLLKKSGSDLKSISNRNQKLSYGFEQARKIQKSSPNKGAFRHLQYPETPENQGVGPLQRGTNNMSTRSSDFGNQQQHDGEATITPFKIQNSPLRPHEPSYYQNFEDASATYQNFQGGSNQQFLKRCMESFENIPVMRGRSFGLPEMDVDETPKFQDTVELAQAINSVQMGQIAEFNQEVQDTAREEAFYQQANNLATENTEAQQMGRFLRTMGSSASSALKQAMNQYANSPVAEQMLEPSLLRRDSLLQRWRAGDKELSGLFKSGLTPGRPNQAKLGPPGRKKSQFFKYKNTSFSSDSEVEDQRLPVAVSSFEPTQPKFHKPKVQQPHNYEKQLWGLQPDGEQNKFQQSKTLDPRFFNPQLKDIFSKQTVDSTQFPYSNTCSGNSAAFESEREAQNSSWHCKRRASHLLTPDSVLLGEMRRREELYPSKRYLSALSSNYSYEDQESSRRRNSGGATTNFNPFLKMTPYGRKGKVMPSPLNSALLNKQSSSPMLPNEQDHFLNQSSSDNLSSSNEQEHNTGYESPRSPKKEKPTKINVELLETPTVNKSRRVFTENDDLDSPQHINYLGRSPRPSYSAESVPLEPSNKRNSGEAGYNKFFLNIPLHSRFMTDYTTLQILGRGSFGTVYRCRNNIDCLEYAVKKRNKKMNSAGRMKEALTQVYALAAVCIAEQNPYIVKYFSGWFQDNELYIVMELCKSSVQKIAESKRKKAIVITEQQVKRIMRDVTLGLKGLHDRFIVHLDIKPENVLVSYSGKYKIGDLGLARLCIQHEDTDIQEGDSRYLAKELLNDFDRVEQIPDLRKADIFSLGAMMYELMSGAQLQTNGDQWHRLRSGTPNMKLLLDRGYTHEMCEWIARMLHPKVEKRPECAELLREFLQSPIEKQLLAEQKRNEELEAKILELEGKLRFYEQRDDSVSRIEI